MTPDNAIVVHANWRDNPWWNEVLEQERLLDLEKYPDRYAHIWEGDYVRAHEGSYFERDLARAKAEDRLSKLSLDPVLPLRAYWDLGFGDATAIWIVQFVAQQIHVLDYIEGVNQPLGYYLSELRARGYERAVCILPHDGENSNSITGHRLEDHVREGGFTAEVVTNMGKGAAVMRIEAVRRLFPKIWFDTDKTEPGRDALGFYHEKRDSERSVGLGPEHDWSSHAADAFGLMAVDYRDPVFTANFRRKLEYPRVGVV